MTTANKIIGALVALVLVVGLGFLVGRSTTIHSTEYQPKAGAALAPVGDLRQLVTWFTGIVYYGSAQQMSVDASGNLSTSGSITTTGVTTTVNGVSEINYRASSMNAASTTNCAFFVSATSTLDVFTANITAGTTTASTLTLATSTSPSASTSPIATKTVAAGAQVTFDWHPGANNSVVSPGTYVNLTQSGGTGTFSNTGTCNAKVRTVN